MMPPRAFTTMKSCRLIIMMLVVIAAVTTPAFGKKRSDSKPKKNEKRYRMGDPVTMLVNKMTSTKEFYPIDYYKMPFCQPLDGVTRIKESTSEILEGDRLDTTPYAIEMEQDSFCEKVCVSNMGTLEQEGRNDNRVVRAIKNGYRTHWWLDGLYAALKLEDDVTVSTRYWDGGVPIGYISPEDGMAYIYNHFNIEISYNKRGTDDNEGHDIVEFKIEPFSIKHEVDIYKFDEDGGKIPLIRPILSCDPSSSRHFHTTYEMVTARDASPQKASGQVLFTYDVIWIEDEETTWSSRWDIYTSMDHAIPDEIFSANMFVSTLYLFVVACCLAVSIRFYFRRLQEHNAGYQGLMASGTGVASIQHHHHHQQQQQFAGTNEHGQAIGVGPNGGDAVRAIGGDVFRPPSFATQVFSVASGTGAQLLSAILLTIFYKATTSLEPRIHKIGVAMIFLWSYALSGIVGGFIAGGMAKHTRSGAYEIQQVIVRTAVILPGTILGYHILIDMTAWIMGSSLAVPFFTEIKLMMLWMFFAVPLTLLGGYWSTKHFVLDAGSVAVRVSERPVPNQAIYNWLVVTMPLCGLFPFLSIFTYYYFLMCSLWMGYGFDHPKSLLVNSAFMLINVAVGTVLATFMQFRNQNHRWWWKSFLNGGSVGIYMFIYAMQFKQSSMDSTSASSSFLYIGTMFILCTMMFLVCGFVGFCSAFVFTVVLYDKLGIVGSEEEEFAVSGYAMIEEPLHLHEETAPLPSSQVAPTVAPPVPAAASMPTGPQTAFL